MTKTGRNEPDEENALLETQRLTYRLLTHNLEDDLYKTLDCQKTCDSVSLFYWPLDRKQTTSFCDIAARVHHNEEGLVFLTYLDEQPAGHLGLFPWDEPDTVEIGYWVSADLQGQGLATEMVEGAIKLARDHFKAKKAVATAALDNERSHNVLIKHGFKETGAKMVKRSNGTLRPSKVFARPL